VCVRVCTCGGLAWCLKQKRFDFDCFGASGREQQQKHGTNESINDNPPMYVDIVSLFLLGLFVLFYRRRLPLLGERGSCFHLSCCLLLLLHAHTQLARTARPASPLSLFFIFCVLLFFTLLFFFGPVLLVVLLSLYLPLLSFPHHSM